MAGSDRCVNTEEGGIVEPVKSGRKGNPKTRTGCVTCKIRRIKCDETKPCCNKCTSTGRKCDGYRSLFTRPPKHHQQSTLARLTPATRINVHLRLTHRYIPASPSDYPETRSGDLRALEYFRCQTATVMGGWLLEPFWKYQLPQLAHSEAALKHVVIGIAVIHENVELLREAGPSSLRPERSWSEETMRVAELHYHAAVAALSRSLSQSNVSEEVVLTSCAMFVVLNFMSGKNFNRAIFHMQHGVEILSRWKKNRVIWEGSLEDNLIALFARISLDSSSMEETIPIDEQNDINLDVFEDFSAAGVAMQALTKEGLRLIRMDVVLSNEGAGSLPRQALNNEVSSHMDNLSTWQSRLETLISDPLFPPTVEEEDLASQLRILHLSARIWIYAGFPTSEPEPTDLFEAFINLVDDHYERCRAGYREQHARHFLFDKGLLPTINFIATTSRSGELRAKAVNIWVKSAPAGIPRPRSLARDFESQEPESKTAKDEVIDVELAPGMNQVGFRLKPSHTNPGGWEVRKEYVT